jgi:NAD(P)-dependent dehydrogenase (short-subunit alcohol dehydrogenase family)
MSGPGGYGSLTGRVALVSGGAQGIGRAIACRFQGAGASVVILDHDSGAGQATAAGLTARNSALPASFLHADLLNSGEIDSAIEKLRAEFGRVDILVNNAGIEIDKPFDKMCLRDWDTILGVNLRGAFLLTKAVLPLFPERGGAIVNISSIHATHAFPDSVAYACSKAGLVAFSRNLALELAGRRIRVNTISPGYIDTRLWDEYLRNSPDAAALEATTTALHPLGRRGIPDDVSEAALFLVSDSAAFITGIDLIVDGGLTIRTHP